ncbi:hypothetical protein COX69_03700 [Candidatus Falkowbacteria bacterium CG_4_10_14_0_2_um_filter_48_10]|uniref:Galactose-1-phosphate uridyl transferase N-terminal domain-containing protein n=1 Tax=Candidatus Falkowbacteria bacterium CG23_combo_of_CG06-09_8_20_14_all_49_15 TaxID=1974572 RepID=A0A2G9ZLT6_9BACT|nr:MAG: hypothetical protein COX22_01075 [Candidatus Falkowbacteria bacterium CG23_combo_of_CG06-09_8_20_14_all_49_15]PJA07839.1 MAG: hypothetical protein COX69_03700 [Candidatus Falkowbacteria bacterium CG_4_10_14_0_2_um_filter_48_10]
MNIQPMPIQESTIRKAYFLEKYVIITPGRAQRPRDIKEETIIKRSPNCPFCPENINQENVVDKIDGPRGHWRVLALNNIFPAVSLDNPRAYGCQEVIVETPEHNCDLAHLSLLNINNLLAMYVRRTKALMANRKLEYILCLKNQGSKAGATIAHAHSQIFATDFLPPDIKEELKRARHYRRQQERCPYCDIIRRETNSPRKIFADKYIAAIAPYASEFHYEAWLFTRRHIDNITNLNQNELHSLAFILKNILVKINKLGLSFNFFLHQVVSEPDQHFYLKIQPRDNIWAGVELGSGLIINSVPPEQAAEYYRL